MRPIFLVLFEMLGRRPRKAAGLLGLIAATLALPASFAQTAAPGPRVPNLILSTDVAIGLIDTNGGKSLAPAVFDQNATPLRDKISAPADIDDGLTLAMALNLDAAGQVNLLAVVPTFGNATLPAEMMVAEHIIRTLKNRDDIPLAPGALGPAAQILNPAPTWFDGTTIGIGGPDGSFARACMNPGVQLMQNTLAVHPRTTILAIGPLTDIACLLLHAPGSSLQNIEEIVVLASRLENEPLLLNGKRVNDFNFRLDPVGGALMLAENARHNVPMRFITFALSGQTSQKDTLIGFDANTFPGPAEKTPVAQNSFKWLLAASKAHNALWKGVFGTIEGPFDQYTLAAALRSNLFECGQALAYVQMCPFPAWSPDYPADANGKPTQTPYNAPDNPCVDHGPDASGVFSLIPAQLVVTQDLSMPGSLVRGQTGIDGNLPQLEGLGAQNVMACTAFADDGAPARFSEFLKKWTW